MTESNLIPHDNIYEMSVISQESINKRYSYYSRAYIVYNIISYSKNREMSFLGSCYNRSFNVRYINCGLIDIFFKQLGIRTRTDLDPNSPFNFFDKQRNYNIYCSLASIDWSLVPEKVFSYNGKLRKSQQAEFKLHMSKYVTDFDCFIDLDGDLDFGEHLDINNNVAINRAKIDAIKLSNLFNSYGLKWTVQFSGRRGFHFFLKIPLSISFDNKIKLSNVICKELRNLLDLPTLDLSELHSRKVGKCPYTLVTNNDLTNVVLPLTDLQLINFEPISCEVSKVLTSVKLINRGLLYRNDSLNNIGFNNFLKDLEICI